MSKDIVKAQAELRNVYELLGRTQRELDEARAKLAEQSVVDKRFEKIEGKINHWSRIIHDFSLRLDEIERGRT